MKSEKEIEEHIELNEGKIFPKGEYYNGFKEGYIAALNWVLDK